jgi:hypothetical protein
MSALSTEPRNARASTSCKIRSLRQFPSILGSGRWRGLPIDGTMSSALPEPPRHRSHMARTARPARHRSSPHGFRRRSRRAVLYLDDVGRLARPERPWASARVPRRGNVFPRRDWGRWLSGSFRADDGVSRPHPADQCHCHRVSTNRLSVETDYRAPTRVRSRISTIARARLSCPNGFPRSGSAGSGPCGNSA